jgi:hypothetical protein
MKIKVIIITSALVLVASVVIGIAVHKARLQKKVLELYGADTDIADKSVKDLKEMIKVYNTKKEGEENGD